MYSFKLPVLHLPHTSSALSFSKPLAATYAFALVDQSCYTNDRFCSHNLYILYLFDRASLVSIVKKKAN